MTPPVRRARSSERASGQPRNRVRAVSGAALMLVASACTTSTPPASQSSAPSEAARTADATASATATRITSDIIGSWHRAQTCEELLATFTAAGLAETHSGWLQGNFYGGEPGPESGDPCAGAAGPLEHSHWFTADGGFGSHDQNGEEVDGGDFALVDEDTLSFPSHSTEFGYDDEILVDFEVRGDGLAIFTVQAPEDCDARCQDAYGWALSAFSSGPWAPGDVP